MANAFLSTPSEFETEPRFPLDVYFCHDCALVQLLDVIDPEVLFRDYIYLTGTSRTMAVHNERYANQVVELLGLTAGDLVVEVASNDGSLLKCLQPYGVRVLGVEPATNIAGLAEAAGIHTLNRFFDGAAGKALREEHGPARVVIGNNVLAHVDDTRDFLSGCRHLLDDDGRVVIEVPYLGEMIDRLEFDTIYHEHLCYFSLTALMRLCEAAGLSVQRVDHIPVHGGSIRMYAARHERNPHHHPTVVEQARREKSQGLTDLRRFLRFASDVESHRRALLDLLKEKATGGRTLAAYGAPAKGNTLLNYCGIDTRFIPYTTDKSPLKVGKYTPGTHLPVLPVSTLLERQPDYTLILAWNFAEEIMTQQQEYRARGGRFIIPIPQPRVV